jgi:hypothetical protein
MNHVGLICEVLRGPDLNHVTVSVDTLLGGLCAVQA